MDERKRRMEEERRGCEGVKGKRRVDKVEGGERGQKR